MAEFSLSKQKKKPVKKKKGWKKIFIEWKNHLRSDNEYVLDPYSGLDFGSYLNSEFSKKNPELEYKKFGFVILIWKKTEFWIWFLVFFRIFGLASYIQKSSK